MFLGFFRLFILDGFLLSLLVGSSLFLFLKFHLKPNFRGKSSHLPQDHIEQDRSFEAFFDEALIQPPFLPPSDPFWYKLFEREWKTFTETIIKKFVLPWYRSLSLDSDEDFIHALSADMNNMGYPLFQIVLRIRELHAQSWTIWMINCALKETVIRHLDNWNPREPMFPLSYADFSISSPVPQDSPSIGHPFIEINRSGTVLLDTVIRKLLSAIDRDANDPVSGSNTNLRKFIHDDQLSHDLLVVILRDVTLTRFIGKIRLGKWIENYLLHRNALINLSSLDLEDDFAPYPIFPSKVNLVSPLIELMQQHTDLKWQQTLCLLTSGAMRIPMMGEWISNRANTFIHKICRRVIHPWVLSKLVHYFTAQMMMDRSIDTSISSFGIEGDFSQRFILGLANHAILHEPIETDAPYLVLKLIDDAYNRFPS
jgi:hypothetical protein